MQKEKGDEVGRDICLSITPFAFTNHPLCDGTALVEWVSTYVEVGH